MARRRRPRKSARPRRAAQASLTLSIVAARSSARRLYLFTKSRHTLSVKRYRAFLSQFRLFVSRVGAGHAGTSRRPTAPRRRPAARRRRRAPGRRRPRRGRARRSERVGGHGLERGCYRRLVRTRALRAASSLTCKRRADRIGAAQPLCSLAVRSCLRACLMAFTDRGDSAVVMLPKGMSADHRRPMSSERPVGSSTGSDRVKGRASAGKTLANRLPTELRAIRAA